MKNLFYTLLILMSISACKKPMQATFQRTPQEQFARENKQVNQQIPKHIDAQKIINTHSVSLNADSYIPKTPNLELLASTKSLVISQRTIIKQKIKPLETKKIKAFMPAKSIKKAYFKPRVNDNFWDNWDKNLKLGVILTALLALLAILGVGGFALGVVALFALWYLVRGLKREL
jgi:hypothetical protein